ncbi:XRE family transcriptional regulator [Neorhizobium lilium]|uniref:XRE family transcriptional regulator n=1 Tax=Neorhizobium lilium TaxID=2503024 RepID=A0A3S3RDP9_9HYPH|nr:helix-turn-helix transcriptional regulator [Neorhizobium lilium]RWX74890.1 XRE family transcriptional regulator [Neorhizobium lilium]
MKDSELNLAIGQRLRMARLEKGLKQSELAAHIGVAFQQIQKYENGSNRLSVAVMLRLCAFMDVNPGDFVSGIADAAETSSGDPADVIAEQIRRIPDDAVRNNLATLIRSLAAV